MNFDSYTAGLLIGLGISFTAGPIAITIVQTSVEKGVKQGLLICAGIWASDAIMIIAALLGVDFVGQYLADETVRTWFYLIGGTVMAILGLWYVFTKKKPMHDFRKNLLMHAKKGASFLKGFALNSVNPTPIFFWCLVLSTHYADTNESYTRVLFLVAGIVTMIFASDILKALLGRWLQKYLSVRNLIWMRLITGVLFFGAGIVLILNGLNHHFKILPGLPT